MEVTLKISEGSLLWAVLVRVLSALSSFNESVICSEQSSRVSGGRTCEAEAGRDAPTSAGKHTYSISHWFSISHLKLTHILFLTPSILIISPCILTSLASLTSLAVNFFLFNCSITQFISLHQLFPLLLFFIPSSTAVKILFLSVNVIAFFSSLSFFLNHSLWLNFTLTFL